MERGSSDLTPNTSDFTSFLHPKANTTAAEWVKSARNAITHERDGGAKATQLFQIVAKDLAATMSMGTDAAPADEEVSLSDYLVSVVGTDISSLTDEQASVLDTFLDLYSDCSRAARAGNGEAAAVTERMQAVAQKLAAGTAPGAPTKGLAARFTSVLSTSLQAVTDGVAMDSPVHRAIATDDLRQLKLAIASGADVNASVLTHGSALDYAATKGTTEMVKVLVEAGATVETAGDYEGSIVQRAASTGDVEMLKALSSSDTDPLTSEWRGLTPLDHAIVDGDEAAVRALAKAGVRVVVGDQFEGSPLHTACALGKIGVAAVLVELGADPNKEDPDGVTPLSYAIDTGAADLIGSLSQMGVDLNELGPDNTTALTYAIEEGKTDMICPLVKAGADPNLEDASGWIPLTYAIKKGKMDMIGLLVEAGADPNHIDAVGGTPLWYALREGKGDMIGLLLEAGADPNLEYAKGWTPLTRAIEGGNADIIGLLVEAGANPNLCDTGGWTPLTYAIEGGKKDMIGLLLEAGADPSLCAANGCTPLRYAIKEGQGDMIGLLVEAGADPNLYDASEWTPLRYAIRRGKKGMIGPLVEAGADPNLYEASGWTPLTYAIERGKKDMIGLLVKAGADPNFVDSRGNTPMRTLCNKFTPSNVQELEEYLELATELCSCGARAKGIARGKGELAHLRQQRPKYGLALERVITAGEYSTVQEEFRRLKMVGHAFHLGGLGLTDSDAPEEEPGEFLVGELEGSFSPGWYREMAKGTTELQHFVADSERELLREVGYFLSRGADQASMGKKGIAKAMAAGKPGVVSTGYVGHDVSGLIFGNYFVICNRGGESRRPVEVYRMKNVTKEALSELIDELSACNSGSRSDYREFLLGLSERFESSETDAAAKLVEEACDLPMQSVGNCSWTSTETAVWAFMALKALGDEKPGSDPVAERLAEVKHHFGHWIAYQRIRTIREYLKVVEERGSTADHGVLRTAFATAWVTTPPGETGLNSTLQDVEAQYLRVLERTDSRRCVEFKTEKLYWTGIVGSWNPVKVMDRRLKPLPEFARAEVKERLHPLWRAVFCT